MKIKRIIAGMLTASIALTSAVLPTFAEQTSLSPKTVLSSENRIDDTVLTGSLTPSSCTMTAGDTIQLKIGSSVVSGYTWTSSNPKVVSVDQNGKATAMAKGKATVTAKDYAGNSYNAVITVDKDSPVKTKSNYSYNISNGKTSSNIEMNDYSVRASTVSSYMYENGGKIYRVENIDGATVVEQLDFSTKKVVSTKTINDELPLFGGFYSGTDYNFVVYGQENPSESNGTEIMRVVKYNKSWKRISSVSVYGANTSIPFKAGSLRMAEQGDILYIHTCHQMYKSQDGYNHQANMTYKISISNMTITEQYYNVMNIAQAGYVSHSFNQYVQTDKDYVYRVDHGDAYPRAVSITRASNSGSFTKVIYTLPVDMTYVDGYNPTGVSVGGFELSDDSCIIVGNAVEVDKASANNVIDCYDNRNIFLTVTDKNLTSNKFIWLTKFDKSSELSAGTPQIVKFGYDNFLVIWEVKSFSNSYYGKYQYTAMVTINGRGELTSSLKYLDTRLSDCKPIYCSDGYIRWYYTDYSAPCVYEICPFDLSMKNPYMPDTVKGFKCGGKTDSVIRLNWAKDSKATGYIIEQYNGQKWVRVAKITDNATTTYRATGLLASSRYAFRIQGYRELANGAFKSSFTNKLVVYTKPKAMTGFKCGGKTSSAIRLNWDENSTATGYIIEQYKDNKWVRIAKITNNATTTYKVTGLTANTRYAFRIQGYKNIPGSAVRTDFTSKLVVYTSK